ncbi:MAG: YceI family protein [Nocardioidaceae bacterium]
MSDLSAAAGTYALDPSHSSVGFVARHAMVTKVRGNFNDVSSTFTIAPEISDSSAEVTINAASVDTRSKDRDAHLVGPDFFDVENFPTITFKTTSVKESSDGVELTGDLKIKDVSKSITIPFEFTGAATDPFGNKRVGFEGQVKVNRKDFGLTWNAALEAGGVLVSENVTLVFDISAVKQ